NPAAICKKRSAASLSTDLAESGHRTVIWVPFFTNEGEISRSTFGSRRTGSISKIIRCALPCASITVTPRVLSSTNAIAKIVFKALPCAPRVGLTYASRLDTRSIIENTPDRLGRKAGTIVRNDDLSGFGRDLDVYFRSNHGLFTCIERVVDQLLQD